MKHIQYIKQASNGCEFYRAESPITHCRSEKWNVISTSCVAPPYPHAVIFQRFPYPGTLAAAGEMKRCGVRVAWELDDDFWHVPQWNPISHSITPEVLANVKMALDLADMILVSTDPLKEVVDRKEKTRVVPNLIDPVAFPRPSEKEGPIRVVWAGSGFHWGDLHIVVEPILRLMQKYGEAVQWIFMGDIPEPLAKYSRIAGSLMGRVVSRYPQVGLVDPVQPVKDYFAALCRLAPDIGLAPLEPSVFNESKSNIKLLEYAMAGAAVVASPVGPYRGISCELEGLCATNADEWVEALTYLIENEKARKDMANLGYLRAVAEFSWQGPGRRIWQEAFDELVGA